MKKYCPHCGQDIEAKLDKKLYLEFVYLEPEKQYEKLLSLYGPEITAEYIQRLNDYVGQIGAVAARKKYVSHYHAILNFIRRDNVKAAGSGPSPALLAKAREQADKICNAWRNWIFDGTPKPILDDKKSVATLINMGGSAIIETMLKEAEGDFNFKQLFSQEYCKQ